MMSHLENNIWLGYSKRTVKKWVSVILFTNCKYFIPCACNNYLVVSLLAPGPFDRVGLFPG